MPNSNDQILANLRALSQAGAPQRPVKSHVSAPAAQIGRRSPMDVLQETTLPLGDEPLAQIGVANTVLKQPHKSMPSGEDLLGMTPMLGTLSKARQGLAAFKPKQPMPSDARMGELIQKFGGMPMDEASRMARAHSQGYTVPAYHGTRDDFTEFHDPIKIGGYGEGDFGIHVAEDPSTANIFGNRAQETGDRMAKEMGVEDYTVKGPVLEHERGGQVLPLMVNPGKSLEMPDMGIWRDPMSWVKKADLVDDKLSTNDPETLGQLLDEARKLVGDPNAPYDLMSRPDVGYNWQSKMREILQNKGYGSIKYPNFTEGDGSPSLMLLDPRQARSRFAVFDPAKRNSRNLLASLAAAVGLASSHEPEE